MGTLSKYIHTGYLWLSEFLLSIPGTDSLTGLLLWALVIAGAGYLLFFSVHIPLTKKGHNRLSAVWQWAFNLILAVPLLIFTYAVVHWAIGYIDVEPKIIKWIAGFGGNGMTVKYLDWAVWKFTGILFLIFLGIGFAGIVLEVTSKVLWFFNTEMLDDVEDMPFDIPIWIIWGAIAGAVHGIFGRIFHKDVVGFITTRFTSGTIGNGWDWVLFVLTLLLTMVLLYAVFRAIINVGALSGFFVIGMVVVAASVFLICSVIAPAVIAIIGGFVLLGSFSDGKMTSIPQRKTSDNMAVRYLEGSGEAIRGKNAHELDQRVEYLNRIKKDSIDRAERARQNDDD